MSLLGACFEYLKTKYCNMIHAHTTHPKLNEIADQITINNKYMK